MDYSYTETQGLQQNYQRDHRIYDVNKNKSVKEWIYSEKIKVFAIEAKYLGKDLSIPSERAAAKAEIIQTIQDYRERN